MDKHTERIKEYAKSMIYNAEQIIKELDQSAETENLVFALNKFGSIEQTAGEAGNYVTDLYFNKNSSGIGII